MRGARQRGGAYARSEAESYGYASEMNPKLKGKKVPMLEERCEEEFCAAPFNHDAAEVRGAAGGARNPGAGGGKPCLALRGPAQGLSAAGACARRSAACVRRARRRSQ
jgi:hypothetical protein